MTQRVVYALLAFCFAVSATVTQARSGCDQVFDDYGSEVFEQLAKEALPPSIEVPVGADVAARLYESSLRTFERDVDFASLRADVGEVSRSGVASPELLLRLKTARKAASILRSVFEVFGKRNEVPEALKEFTKVFGELNDALEAGASIRDVQKAARLLERATEPEAIVSAARGFEAAREAKAERFLRSELAEIDTALAKKTVRTDKFHDARKSLKSFLTVFILLPETSTTIRVRDYLKRLNDELGAVHDTLVHSDIKGDLVYDDVRIRILKSVRRAIENFTDRVDVVR